MQYISTRGEQTPKRFSDILFEGRAEDGGLYVPAAFPRLTLDQIRVMRGLDYAGLALEVMHLFWPELDRPTLWKLCRDTYQPEFYPYGRDRISSREVTPITWLHDDVGLLELSNGPTLSFDDISLSLLANIFARGLGNAPATMTFLGATTGDMGAACEHAFAEIPNARVAMLSPQGRMSDWQAAQLYANAPANSVNLAVDGTFDDCQDMVERMLSDRKFAKKHGLGAVNSVLWARIAAQIVYYFYAYLQAVESVGEEVVFVVPGGNFGNAFAGWAAKQMGLPILRLIVATNENDAMDRFLRTGVYAPRPASETLATSSPSMDISRAANFERFLYEMLDRNARRTAELMKELETKGSFELTPGEFARVRRSGLASGTSNHANRLEITEHLYVEYGTYVDPHTADAIYSGIYLHPVGVRTLCLETVDPAKFPKIIRQATGHDVPVPEGFEDPRGKPAEKTYMPNDFDAVKAFVAEFADKPF